MLGIASKTAIGIAATGILSVGAWVLHEKTKPTNLGEKLSWNGSILLSVDSDAHKSEWERIVQIYENSQNNWKIDTLNMTSGDANRASNIAQLKNKCKELFNISLDDSQISDKMALATNWCIKNAKGELNKPQQ